MAEQPSLAATVGDYQTVVSIVTAPVGSFGKILNADPRRWCVRFMIDPLLGIGLVLAPGPIPPGFAPTSSTRESVEVKFRDAPSWATGEWYAIDPAGSQIVIWECLYVR